MDDMHDMPSELDRWPQLVEPLRLCKDVIVPAFRSSDESAIRHQWAHRLLTKLAAASGTAAVLFAIVQLGYPHWLGPDLLGGTALETLEILAAFAAFTAVVLGLISSRQSNWLLERHKAERLRLAKFRFLIQPDVWRSTGTIDPEVAEQLRHEVEKIRSLTASDLREWVEVEGLNPTSPPDPGDTTGTAFDQVIDYYSTKRLKVQSDFFHHRARRHEQFDKVTRHLSPALFFGSVLAVFFHLLIKRIGDEAGPPGLELLLIVLAASLPTLGAGIRTLRLAYEFARNTSRYRAKALALDRLREILRQETKSWYKIKEVWYSEESLEIEHREWCRLMLEAEWLP